MSERGRSSLYLIFTRLIDSLRPTKLKLKGKFIDSDYLGNSYYEISAGLCLNNFEYLNLTIIIKIKLAKKHLKDGLFPRQKIIGIKNCLQNGMVINLLN